MTHISPQISALSTPRRDRDWTWPYWPVVPLYPYGQRWTIRREIIPEQIWTFEQVQGIFYVIVPVRMTVIRLQAGGLLVYAPVAPTRECLRLMQELVQRHGEVKYIILPTVSAIEHKAPAAAFARQFTQAQVFVAPHQWSFPLNLPLSWLGFPMGRTQVLPDQSCDAPFGDEFDYRTLGPISLSLGPFEETAFLHRATGTLLVTDTVMSIPAEPPEVVNAQPYPLLFHARETPFEAIADSPAQRRKGWQRISLFAFYFRPSALSILPWGETLQAAKDASDRSRRAYFGLFPFRWKANWKTSFEVLRDSGRLLVAPILQRLILNRAPVQVLAWADQVASWNFQRIIPAHFDAPVVANGQDFRAAFRFLEGDRSRQGGGLPEADFMLIDQLDQQLQKIIPLPLSTQQD